MLYRRVLIGLSLLIAILKCSAANENTFRTGNISLIATDSERISNISSKKHNLATAAGYGFLCVTVVNLSALLGLIFTLLRKYRFYTHLLSFMVATAVGSLLSSSVIVLIPESLKLMDLLPSGTSSNWYVSRSASICSGVFLFYILEFLLKQIPDFVRIHQNTSKSINKAGPVANCTTLNPQSFHQLNEFVHIGENDNAPIQSNSVTCFQTSSIGDYPPNELPKSPETDHNVYIKQISHTLELNADPSEPCNSIINCHSSHKLCSLTPLAWMILIGDGVHNFMDGLTIGVGFTHAISLGINLTLAVLCEELPHELGDIAVLLRSGLSIPRALCFNFLSACTAYLGFIVGLFVGELSSVGLYVFSITAGFFLYISLSDMLPELRKMEDAAKMENRNVLVIFFLHLAGLLFGFSCILTVTLTSQFIAI